MTEQNKVFLAWYKSYAKSALLNNERRLVILSGQESWALSLLSTIDEVSQALINRLTPTLAEPKKRCLIFGDSTIFAANVAQKRFREQLGSESDVIIFADSQFTIDAFAALSGTLKAGGICFLIIPSLANRLAESHFFKRFYALFSNNTSHTLVCEPKLNEKQVFSLPASPVHAIGDKTDLNSANIEISHLGLDCGINQSSSLLASSTTYPQGCITAEQYSAVQAILKVVSGHRKRPLVLTADRGRGKSSALAIACAQLMKEREYSDFSLVITAPDIQSVAIFYQQLSKSLLTAERNGNCVTFGKSRLTFIAIDQLIKQPVKCNLLMVDEAAAIPVYVLEQLLAHYHRLVFSSTVHGYEGAGRGFTLKFQKILHRLCPQWANLHINQPIRWRENDPLEHLVFAACLLNAELAELTLPELGLRESNCLVDINRLTAALEFKIITAKELIADEAILKQVFAVLVTAHYQTKPSDLVLLLDKAQVQLACLVATANNKTEVIAVALLMKEGAGVNVNSADVLDVKRSKRRLRDHFLPQSLLSHCGFESAFTYRYLRVLRIAVHPSVQQQGIGSYFIKSIEAFAKNQGQDFIGSSFGANPELLSFWLKAGFTTARVGFTKDKASGEHSALMVKGLNDDGEVCADNFATEFYRTFDYLLLEEYKFLAADLTYLLLSNNVATNLVTMSELDIANVRAYATGERLFSSCAYSLYLWFQHDLLDRNKKSPCSVENENIENEPVNMKLVLIARLIQKHDIKSVCQQYGFTGKKAINESIKAYVKSQLAPLSR